MRVRKKPVEVDAEHFVDVKNPPVGVCVCKDGAHIGTHVHTMEGILATVPGDWIIKGVLGERYPCKAEAFDLTYDLIKGRPFVILFDTETNGLPKDYKAPASAGDNWPRLVQLAWVVYDDQGELIEQGSRIIRPAGFTINPEAAAIHRITQERAEKEGQPLAAVLEEFLEAFNTARVVAGHNVIGFDKNVVGSEFIRTGVLRVANTPEWICTMKASTPVCKIPGKFGFKWPTLSELYRHLFQEDLVEAHDALVDVKATARCFWTLVDRGVIKIPSINWKPS